MGESAPLKMAPFVPFSQMRASPRWSAFPTLLNAATMLNPTEMGQMAPRQASPHSHRELAVNSSSFRACTAQWWTMNSSRHPDLSRSLGFISTTQPPSWCSSWSWVQYAEGKPPHQESAKIYMSRMISVADLRKVEVGMSTSSASDLLESS